MSTSRTQPNETDGQALHLTQAIADKFYDGHVALLRFTTNWRVSFGTDYAFGADLHDSISRIHDIPSGATLMDAVIAAIDAIPNNAVTAFKEALCEEQKKSR
jgi:hypothetical protein